MSDIPKAGDWAALFGLTCLWGTSFAFNEVALTSFPTTVIVSVRVIVAAIVLYAFMRASGVRLPRTLAGWTPMLLVAIFGNILPFQLIVTGQQHIDSSVAGVLMAIMPLFVLTLAHFFLPGSRLTAHRVAGFLFGFAGVFFVIGPDVLNGLRNNAALWGAIAILGAALSYAINSIYVRHIGARDPVQLAAGTMLVACLLSLPQAAQQVPALAPPTVSAMLAVIILGLGSTGVATVLYFRVIQGPGPAFLSLVNYLVPAWAIIAGSWFLHETLAVTVYVGLALILVGIAVSEFGPRLTAAVRTRLRIPVSKT